MSALAVVHLANVMFYALQSVAFAYLWRRRRDTSIARWFAAVLLMLVFSIAGAVSALVPGFQIEVPCLLLILAACACLTDGALRFAERRLSRLQWLITMLVGLWAGVAFGFGVSLQIASLPAALWLPLVLITGGVRLLRTAPGKTVGGRWAGIGLVVAGVHFANYPLLRSVEWFAPLGFAIASILELVIVIGLLVVHFEAAQSKARALATELEQARKLEALGRVVGGIAHDFNNLLTVILAGTQTLLRSSAITPNERTLLARVCEASDRAAELTGQLLAFSRRRRPPASVTDLVSCVRKLKGTVQSIVGDETRIELALPDAAVAVRVDPAQLGQLILNLVVNARDAIAAGGTVTLAVAPVEDGSAELAGAPGTAAGKLVSIEVRDTGQGMPPEVVERAFEPFYTTKDGQAGTGLGLSIVHGIVHQAGGDIRIDSQVGKGTTVRILLPAEETDQLPEPSPPAFATGSGFVLLAEDEALVRATTRQVLESAGYQVIEATHGEEALRAFAENADRVDLVISDIVMPRMTGTQLAEQLLERAPGLPILLVSGFPDRIAARSRPLDPRTAFLAKPYTPDALLVAVARVLADRPRRSGKGASEAADRSPPPS